MGREARKKGRGRGRGRERTRERKSFAFEREGKAMLDKKREKVKPNTELF